MLKYNIYMNHNQSLQRNKIVKSIFEKFLIILFVFLIVYFIKEGLDIYAKLVLVKDKTAAAHMEYDHVNDSLEKKKRDLEFIQSRRGKEEYLRTTLPVAMEGEKVIILYDATSSALTDIKIEKSWWDEVKQKLIYFKDNYTNL